MMIQRNMVETISVLRVQASRMVQFSRRENSAASVASSAPTAELSTRLVTPVRNRPIISPNTPSGRMPARARAIFSAVDMRSRSSAGSTGASSGWMRQRT
ncbi:hypothetical protein D3C87_1457020 [compost metagenome]